MFLRIDWNNILMGDDNWRFIFEITFRTILMYFIILIGLKLLGKRGVKQLSVFELVVIISLGSAAGDPMFYKEVGMIEPIVVFAVIVAAYRLTTFVMAKSRKFDKLVEGDAAYLIIDGEFSISDFKKENLAKDEFFSELRLQSISHLGQVETAILETSGNLSIYLYEDEKVRYGLPILPKLFDQASKEISTAGIYACMFCGNVEELELSKSRKCERCGNHEWVAAINSRRVN
ncbi:uncharacterized membrane protein YcaP (DUF421 family) [Pedobacter sp. UYP30]|uniref:DUF421 domain-containing protein n=1 Tax=Pedobacter sp. UYP30 TaxID=1756400 RepID=UPI003390E11B